MRKTKEEKMRTALFSLNYLFDNLDAFKEFRLKNNWNKKLIKDMKKIIADALKGEMK